MHLRIIYYYKFSEHNDNIFYKKMQEFYKSVKVYKSYSQTILC